MKDDEAIRSEDAGHSPVPLNGKNTDADRWRVLALVCLAIVLSMTTWFSATAIGPDLARIWHLSASQASWLTNTVQLGFVTGALFASLVSLPDLVSLRKLMGISAIAAAAANLCLLWAPSFGALLAARFVTGVALAGIYPPSLKLIATWFKQGRGLALGALIAALTLGSASPHLVRVLSDHVDWRLVVVVASAATLLGAILLLAFAREGPYSFSKAAFDPRQLGIVLRNRQLAYANLGYFGHMWELYAMWGWFLAFASEALPGFGVADARAASLLTFAVIASGVVGALLGGVLADRIGRAAAAAAMLLMSGCCALAIGFTFAGPYWLFVAVAIVWGASVIGDSAQFSALATEVTDSRYVGTALAFQLGAGFALTVISIRLTPWLASLVGWRWCFLFLVPGPIIGIGAMMMLRHQQAHPDRADRPSRQPARG